MDATQAIIYYFNSAPGGVHNDLWNDLQGRMEEGEIIDDNTYPRAAIQNITDVSDNVFAKKGKNLLRQLSIVSTSLSEIKLMRDHAETLFDNCQLNITGYSLAWMRLTNIIGPSRAIGVLVEGVENVWECHLEFELDIQQS